MTWGVWGSAFSKRQMTAYMEANVEMGISTFDHADIYGHYTTEAAFGAAFSESSIDRSQVQFISKCGIQLPCDARPLKVQHYDYSKAHIRMSVENSLNYLQTDYLDLLLLHRPSPLMEVHEIAEVLNALKKEGKIKAIGVSNFTSSQLTLLQQALPIAWNQLECSLTHSEPIFDGTLDAMRSSGVQAMAWGALGNYFKKKTPAQQRIATLMTVLCDQYQCSEAQLLIAWLLKHPAPIHPVVGTTDPNRMQAFIDAVNIPLDIQDWFLLLEASLGKPVP